MTTTAAETAAKLAARYTGQLRPEAREQLITAMTEELAAARAEGEKAGKEKAAKLADDLAATYYGQTKGAREEAKVIFTQRYHAANELAAHIRAAQP